MLFNNLHTLSLAIKAITKTVIKGSPTTKPKTKFSSDVTSNLDTSSQLTVLPDLNASQVRFFGVTQKNTIIFVGNSFSF